MRVTVLRVAAAGALVATTSLVAFAATHTSWRIGPVAAPAATFTPASAASRPVSLTPVVTTPVATTAVAAEPVRVEAPGPVTAAPVVETTPRPVRVAAATTPPAPAPTAAPTPAPAPADAAPACPGNPKALGVSRVVEIDTTGGPGFGFEHFKAYDFLKINEVVLTFDDGPWPNNTPAVLAALAANCTKALFFPIGKHALWHPEILKEVAAAGHTIGSHTWSHADLSKKKPEEAKDEIEKGLSAVRLALGSETPSAPFFRFPYLRHPPEMLTYLAERNIGVFSTDMDSFDFKLRKPDAVVQSVMNKLRKHGKGIILMHDFQQHTAQALPELLRQLQAGGYKVVQIKAKDAVKSLPNYDAMMAQEIKGASAGRPISNVVRTIGTYGDTPPTTQAPK
jgi:peptidoglycan/xylan/chitin deacetylase (PgdA/CDA1 family)